MLANVESSNFWEKIFTHVQALLYEGLIGLTFRVRIEYGYFFDYPLKSGYVFWSPQFYLYTQYAIRCSLHAVAQR